MRPVSRAEDTARLSSFQLYGLCAFPVNPFFFDNPPYRERLGAQARKDSEQVSLKRILRQGEPLIERPGTE